MESTGSDAGGQMAQRKPGSSYDIWKTEALKLDGH